MGGNCHRKSKSCAIGSPRELLQSLPKTWGEVYSRNLAHRQLFVSNSAQKSLSEHQNACGLNTNRPDFAEKSHGDSASLNIEVHGEKPMGRALEILQKRERANVLKRAGELLREAYVEVLDEQDGRIVTGPQTRKEEILHETNPKKTKAIS